MFASSSKMLWLTILTFLTVCYGSQMQARISGGSEDDSQTFLVSLRYNGRHFCAGSLISKNKVLTAAHCIYGLPMYSLRLRTYDGFYHEVVNVQTHPNFRKYSIRYDIGYITFDNPMTVYDVISLPPSATTLGQRLLISGWGSTAPSGSLNTNGNPNSAFVTTISLQACRDSYTQNDVTSTMLCTVGAGACYGDDGGPLFGSSIDGIPILYGVISWGTSCQNVSMPLVHTDVFQFRSYINSIL